MKTIFCLIQTLLLTSFMTPARAQQVFFSDPGLSAAIRDALKKPTGPLSQQDLLTLTNLNACCRNISSVGGLQDARNLISLDLQQNRLTNFALPSSLTNLTGLDLSLNSLTQCSFPSASTNLTRLILTGNLLTNFRSQRT